MKIICDAYDYCIVAGCSHKIPHIGNFLCCEQACENDRAPFGGGHTCKEYKDPLNKMVDELFEDIEL